MNLYNSSGPKEAWRIAVKEGQWGIRSSPILKGHWDDLTEGDLLSSYVSGEVGGFVGLSMIERKYEANEPLWPEEKQEREVLFPFRFEFDSIYLLREDEWEKKKIPKNDMRVDIQGGLKPVKSAKEELLDEMQERWKFEPPTTNQSDPARENLTESISDDTEENRVQPDKKEEKDLNEFSLTALSEKIVDASGDGSRNKEFEQLIAEAFRRIGCEAHWIEGGGDTDVEIQYPVETVVEVKTRSNSQTVQRVNASRIVRHKEDRDGEHALIIGPQFSPGAATDAEQNGITVLRADQLVTILDYREKYGLPPEIVFKQLQDPGLVEESLEHLGGYAQTRISSLEMVHDIMKALEIFDEPKSASNIHAAATAMSRQDRSTVPSKTEVRHTLQLLSHPSLSLVEVSEDSGTRYELLTSSDNAMSVLRSFGSLQRGEDK